MEWMPLLAAQASEGLAIDGSLIKLVSIVLALGIPIAAITSTYTYLALKARYESQLKQRMIERGMSADEIERVLRAGHKG